MRVKIPKVKVDIPVVIVFRALGIVPDRDVLSHICFDESDSATLEMLQPSIEEAFAVQDRDAALDFIGRRAQIEMSTRQARQRAAFDILQMELLPHVSVSEGFESKKAYFLGYMIQRLCSATLGRKELDDRDHFGNKRLDLAGPLLANLFRQLFYRFTKRIRDELQKCIAAGKTFTLSQTIRPHIITDGFRTAISTGNWPTGSTSHRVGVSQVLNRYTYASTLSHLRRTNTPIDRGSKATKPRQLHNTHWGMVCPAETPEGAACGLVKNLALMSYVSVGSYSAPVMEFLEEWGLEDQSEYIHAPHATKVFVNGVWMGIHRDAPSLHQNLLTMRRSGSLKHEVSIVRDIRERELRLYTDYGRVCRPLIIVDQDTQLPRLKPEHITMIDNPEDYPQIQAAGGTWQYLLNSGIIEYVDAAEEETILIAMSAEDLENARKKGGRAELVRDRAAHDMADFDPAARVKSTNWSRNYTHMEIHPSMILGICGSIIPFPDHNQVYLHWLLQGIMLNILVSTKYISICYGQASHGHPLNELPATDGHNGQRPLLPSEASRHHSINALPQILRAACRTECYRCHHDLFRIQPRRFRHHEPKFH